MILAILVVGGIGIGIWMMRENKSSKSSRDLLIISTNGGETYKIVEEGKESYENNHGENGQNGEEWIRYFRTDKSILDQIREDEGEFNDPSRCDNYECKEVNMRVSEDVFWLLQKMYQEVRNVTFSELRDIEEFQTLIEGYKIVKLNPITIRYDNDIEENKEWVVGNKDGNLPLLYGYLSVLFTYKRKGKSLPRPDPTSDYAVTFDF